MREIRKSGSEGGAGQNNVPFLPLSFFCDAKSNSNRERLFAVKWQRPVLAKWLG